MNILQERGWLKSLKFEKSAFKWDKLENVSSKVNEWLEEENLSVGVLYDVDVDGLFSGYFIENYCTRLGKRVCRKMNEGKVHGLEKTCDDVLEWVNLKGIGLLFVPDAGTNDTSSLKRFSELGIKVVVIDHHDIEGDIYEDDNIKVLNTNEDDNVPNLSGAGITYRFIEELNKNEGKGLDISVYENLVGITVLSDVCDMSDNENRYYVKKLYDNYNRYEFFKFFDYYGSDASLMSFKVIPFLNALIRLNEIEAAMDIVNNLNEVRVLKRLVENKIYVIKERQKNLVNKVLESGKLLENNYCVIHLRSDSYGKEVNGLLANKLLGEYDKSALVVVYDKDTNTINGSFRGLNFDNTVLKRYGLDCRGHLQACGVTSDKETFMTMCKNFEVNEDELIDVSLTSYDVEILERDIDDGLFTKIAVFNEFSGHNVSPIRIKIKEPNIFISDIQQYLNYKNIIIGNHLIKDFTDREVETLVISPTFDKIKSKYSLIRV